MEKRHLAQLQTCFLAWIWSKYFLALTFLHPVAAVQVDTIAQEVEKAGVGYVCKEKLPVNILGLVDDMVGVTEAGHQAQVMNAILNIKSAE